MLMAAKACYSSTQPRVFDAPKVTYRKLTTSLSSPSLKPAAQLPTSTAEPHRYRCCACAAAPSTRRLRRSASALHSAFPQSAAASFLASRLRSHHNHLPPPRAMAASVAVEAAPQQPIHLQPTEVGAVAAATPADPSKLSRPSHADDATSSMANPGPQPRPHSDQQLLRPLQPSDERRILSIWLEGWDATIAQFVPKMWGELMRDVLTKAAAVLSCLALCALPALLRAHAARAAAVSAAASAAASYAQQQPAVQWLAALLPDGVPPVLRQGAAVLWEAASALPAWALALCAAAVVVLCGALALAPLRMRMPLLRRRFHLRVRSFCPDMWSLHRSWVRPAEGREYWVVELQGSGQVVGGVGIKVGAALRPLKEAPAPAAAAHAASAPAEAGNVVAKAGGYGAWQQPEEPPEDASGFTKSDLESHGGALGPSDALIYRMVTDTRLRRRGIGRQLVEHALTRAADAGVGRVLLATANADAVAFYVACGFEVLPGPPSPWGSKILWRALGRPQGTADGSGSTTMAATSTAMPAVAVVGA